MTTWDNILYGPRARGELTPRRSSSPSSCWQGRPAGLPHKYPTQLSGGMQRRAELARAMINNPQIMILDEPFRGLDAMTKELMWEYYSALYEENRRTNFFVTTDIDEAIFLADRLLIMSNIPTQVRAVFEVDVPRPRKLGSLIENDRANEIKMQALSILHEEAMKSFSPRQQGRRRLRRRVLEADGEELRPARVDFLLSRETVIVLACWAPSHRCRDAAARAFGRARADAQCRGYALMATSMLVFIVAGFRSA
jgi:ABC-type sulfate/molybdate transport systems ATPase subunit